MFQSLTGSIHTQNFILWTCILILRFNPSQVQFTRSLRYFPGLVEPVSIPHRFNSHFKLLSPNISKFIKFQSLTGSIHTERVFRRYLQSSYVSIPHRFNSHPHWKLMREFFERFQSLTGSIHTFFRLFQFFFNFMFQSLTGSIHTN